MGMTETEEDRIERYILTMFPEAKYTPAHKTGHKLEFGHTKTEQFTEIVEVKGEQETSSEESSEDTESEESENEEKGSETDKESEKNESEIEEVDV
jgi:hypothetical protein